MLLKESKFIDLRKLLKQQELVRVIGVGDAISSTLAAETGFDAVWASGLCISATMGLPDAGILTMTELLAMTRIIDRSTNLPVIADCDTGFGDVDNVTHMVKEYEHAGIAAVCIEDKCFPKTNSFFGKQDLASIEEFCNRVKAAKLAASKDGILIIARIEALVAGTGLADAIRRAIAYVDSGADAILIHSKSKTPDEIISFCKLWQKIGKDVPIILVPTTYYSITAAEMKDIGVRVVIFANHPLRASLKAIKSTLQSISEATSTAQIENSISSVSEVFKLIGMDKLGRESNVTTLPTIENKQYVLLNPGPVNVDNNVRAALNGPDLCHREPEFLQILSSVRNKIVEICGGNSEHAAVILTGSGTAALESTITSIVPKGGKILVLDNGRYGERISKIAASYNIPFEHIKFGWGQPFDLEKVKEILQTDPQISTIGMAHHETSTGMLNPLSELGKLSRKYNKELVIDAISSLGGENLNIIMDNVDWCVGSSNKCIEGTPGLSFVCGKDKSFKSLVDRPRHGFYLDLWAHYDSQYNKNAPLFTPAVQIFYSFEQALQNLIDETVEKRHARYWRYANRMRQALKHLGFRFLIDEQYMSCVVTIVYLPEKVTYAQLHDALKEKGFIIYTGQEDPNPVFRVATIGQLTDSDIETFIFTLEHIMQSFNSTRVIKNATNS